MRFETAAAAAISAACLLVPQAASAASSPYGVWINDTGRGAIEIKNCRGALCGHVVWVKSNSDNKGCGKQIIGEARSAGANRWDGGWIYSPEKRRRYNVELKPLSESRLQVVGYAGMKLFSRTMIWKRASGDLQRCDRPAIEAAKTMTVPADEKPATVATVRAAKTAEAQVPSAAASAKPGEPQVPASAAPAGEKPAAQAAAAATADAKAVQAPPANADGEDAGTLAEDSAGTTPDTAPSSATGDEESAAASADDDGNTDDNDPGSAPMAKGGLSLGDINLDKILTRSGNGKCKVDLPWVKVDFDCNR